MRTPDQRSKSAVACSYCLPCWTKIIQCCHWCVHLLGTIHFQLPSTFTNMPSFLHSCNCNVQTHLWNIEKTRKYTSKTQYGNLIAAQFARRDIDLSCPREAHFQTKARISKKTTFPTSDDVSYREEPTSLLSHNHNSNQASSYCIRTTRSCCRFIVGWLQIATTVVL